MDRLTANLSANKKQCAKHKKTYQPQNIDTSETKPS